MLPLMALEEGASCPSSFWWPQTLLACGSTIPVLASVFRWYLLVSIYLFLERGERREKEREGNINVWLPLACPQLETWPETQPRALTGN